MTARIGKRAARRQPLSAEKVLRTAMRMADERGLDFLSMRNLGRALKVEAMSIYNHVAGKERILDGLVDLVVGEIALPRRDVEWRIAMCERALSAHAALMRHPWATMLFVSRLNVGPNMLRYVDATIGCLLNGGFSYAMADHAWNALDSFTYGFTLQKLNFPLQPEEYVSAAAGFLPMIPPERFPWMNAMTQEVISGRHSGLHDLQLGLDLLLDGLERLRLSHADEMGRQPPREPAR